MCGRAGGGVRGEEDKFAFIFNGQTYTQSVVPISHPTTPGERGTFYLPCKTRNL